MRLRASFMVDSIISRTRTNSRQSREYVMRPPTPALWEDQRNAKRPAPSHSPRDCGPWRHLHMVSDRRSVSISASGKNGKRIGGRLPATRQAENRFGFHACETHFAAPRARTYPQKPTRSRPRRHSFSQSE